MWTSCGNRRHGHAGKRHARFRALLLCSPVVGVLLSSTDCRGQAPMLYGPHLHTAGSPGLRNSQPSPILQVENATAAPGERPLPSMVEALPVVQEEMELIERRSQLLVARSNLVRAAIADPSIIDVVQYSPREISIVGMARGSTTLTLWFDGMPDPLIYLVRVIRDPNVEYQKRVDYGKLEKKLALLFPNSKVYLVPLSYKIVVRGQARDAEEAAQILSIIRGEIINQEGSLVGPGAYANNAAPAGAGGALGIGYGAGYGPWGANDLLSGFIINQLRVPGEFQVQLRVRIAELNRSQLRRLGVDLSALLNDGRHLIASTVGGIPSTLTGLFENGEIGVAIDWLASNGVAKILDEPNLTVLSGRTASFLSGGEFAVPTIIGIDGVGGQSTTFRGFGTSLIVTPTIINKDLLRLQIVSEFSSLNQQNAVNNIPGTNARRVNTTIEMREGQTLALAGLLSHQTNTEVTRIPWLGDLPLVGPLFSAKRATQDETELLILVTPELVRPMDAQEVPPVPGFEVTPPAAKELFKYGMVEGFPDTGHYQLPPYGSGSIGTDVGYQPFNPGPASPMYSPVPTNPYGVGPAAPQGPPPGMPQGMPAGQAYPPPVPPANTMPGQYGPPSVPNPSGPLLPGQTPLRMAPPNMVPQAPGYAPPQSPNPIPDPSVGHAPAARTGIQPASYEAEPKAGATQPANWNRPAAGTTPSPLVPGEKPSRFGGWSR